MIRKVKRRRSVSESGRLVNGRVSELSPQHDARKSFYGKAHVVTDSDGTQILYSYNTPVVEIKDDNVKLLAMWDSSQTTLRHVKEFLQQNGFSVGSKQQIARLYGGANESRMRAKRQLVTEDDEDYSYSYDDLAENPYPDYDGLNDVINKQEELVATLSDFKDWADSILSVKFTDYNDAVEAFSGPDDAIDYANKLDSIIKGVKKLSDRFDELVDRYGL